MSLSSSRSAERVAGEAARPFGRAVLSAWGAGSGHLIVLGLAVAGAGALVLVTPLGIGLSPDSVSYIGGARNILAGKGFSMPPMDEAIVHLAPLYSFLLAAIGLAGLDPADGARWIGAVFFGLNLYLVYCLATCSRNQGDSGRDWAALAVTGLALTAKPLWDIHLMAWTEPVFVGFCLGAIGTVAVFARNRRRRWLVLSAALTALAVMTRYAGLSMWAAFALFLLIQRAVSMRRKLLDIGLFSTVALMPFVAWAIRNQGAAGSATNRSFSFHPVGFDRLHEGLATAAAWLMVPHQAGGWTKTAVLLVGFGFLVTGVVLWARARVSSGPGAVFPITPVLEATLVASLVYPLFLLFSISFFDANTPLDQRILAPLFTLLLVPLAFGVRSWEGWARGRWTIRLVLQLLLCLGAVAHVQASLPMIRESRSEGLGFNNARWRKSELMVEIRRLPADRIVYTNSPDALYLHAGLRGRKIPQPVLRVTRSRNPDYSLELTAMRSALEEGGLLVYFDLGVDPERNSRDGLVHHLGLTPAGVFSDGVIFTK